MKQSMRFACMMMTLCLGMTAIAFAERSGAVEPMNKEVSSLEFLSKLSVGWNLGNDFDAYNNGVSSQTAWSNAAASQALFNGVKKAGFDVVRMPVTWLGHIGTKKSGYKLDEAWLEEVASAVAMAHKAGLTVIINIHHDDKEEGWLSIKKAAADPLAEKEIREELVSVWTQIAQYFKNSGDYLLFETFNEVQDGGWGWGNNRRDGGKQYDILNGWLLAVVNAIRATGGNNAYRYIVLNGYSTNANLTVQNLVIPEDPTPAKVKRLIISVHYYDPYKFGIEATTHTWGRDAGAQGTDGESQEGSLRGTFASLKRTYVDKGYGVYIGECGVVYQKGYEKYREYYIEYVMKCAHDDNLLPIYWDNGYSGSGKETFGLFDRATGAVFSADKNNAASVISVMMKAVNTKDEKYTLQSITNEYMKVFAQK
jgi:aryl-phospho-beta-D-glucosidase BglC (GH1 family)